MSKILLIDGSNLLYRAYYATENKEMISPEGMDVNAIYTVVSMLKKYIDDFNPSHVFVALDEGKDTFRHQAYEDYKGQRPPTPDRLKQQFGLVRELYEKMGIVALGHENYEADDLIATLAKQAEAQAMEVQVVSSDKDLLQIISNHTKVFVPKSNSFGKDINYTPSSFFDKFDIHVDQWTLYKALVGDKSDNIIGANKIGPKTAVSLIREYQSLDKILQAAKNGELKPAQNKNISEAAEQLVNNLKLVTLVDDIDLDITLDDLAFSGFSNEELLTFFHRHGMQRHLTSFQKIMGKTTEVKGSDFTILDAFDKKLIGKENYIYTQTLGENYFTSEKLGVGIYNEHGLFYLPQDNVNDTFINFLEDDSKKITYDLKQLMGIFNLKEVGNFICDVRIANSVINPDNFKKSFDFICLEHKIEGVFSYNTIYGTKANPQLDIEKVKIDLTSKAKALSELFIVVANKLETSKLSDVYYRIEHPLIPVLARMEINGILLDQDKLASLQQEYEQKMDDLNTKLASFSDINVNSPKQLSNYIFEDLQAPTVGVKKTQSGYSTDQESLSNVLLNVEEDDTVYQFISTLLEYRRINKIYTTYLLGLEKHLIDGKLHPIYQQCLTETGRLSATEPNIQNIPTRTEEGKEIRALFNAPQGYKFVTCDYSQVELRVIAQLSQEQQMLDNFKHHLDIHEQTAKKIFNQDTVSPDLRSRAKAINFGIIYGISPYGLAKQINSSVSEASAFIKTYLATYPQIKEYQEQLVKQAFKDGFIKTYFNRIRYINNKATKNSEIEAIKRICINTPIQGTAADIIKLAMIEVDKYINQENIDATMIMQIHDELVFYINEKDIDQVDKIQEIMENIVDFDVKLEADSGIGDNWKEAK